MDSGRLPVFFLVCTAFHIATVTEAVMPVALAIREFLWD